MNDNNDILDPGSLPPDPATAALMLLGFTSASLKDIDSNIVGSSNSIRGLKTDLNKIALEVHEKLVPKQNTFINPESLPTNTFNTSNIPVSQVQAAQPTPPVNNNGEVQLELDFYRKVKPEDIELELKNIKKSIKNLESKIDSLISISQKKTVKNNGN